MKNEAIRIFWQFEPDRMAAASISAEIHRRLIDSLDYVFGEYGDDLDCPGPLFERWMSEMGAAKRLAPIGHTLFHSLVDDVERGDLTAARAAAARLVRVEAASDRLDLHALEDDPASDHPLALFSRFADLEEENRLDFAAPRPGEVAAFEPLFRRGWEYVAERDPALEGEFSELVVELLLVSQLPSHRFTTAAVSCFQNWGGLIVNPAVAMEPLDIVDMIAHESTHLLLFGLALDEPLLTNPPEEQYYSPLRETSRSMDGVFHATIVAARVARAMMKQAACAEPSEPHRQAAIQRGRRAVQLFRDGFVIIENNALLTRSGEMILHDCRTAMDEMDFGIRL